MAEWRWALAPRAAGSAGRRRRARPPGRPRAPAEPLWPVQRRGGGGSLRARQSHAPTCKDTELEPRLAPHLRQRHSLHSIHSLYTHKYSEYRVYKHIECRLAPHLRRTPAAVAAAAAARCFGRLRYSRRCARGRVLLHVRPVAVRGQNVPRAHVRLAAASAAGAAVGPSGAAAAATRAVSPCARGSDTLP